MQSNTNLKLNTNTGEKFPSLDIQYDEKKALAWCRMNAYPRPCFTLELLDSFQSWFKDLVQDEQHNNLKYLVFGSNVPGSFNLGGDLKLFYGLIKTQNRKELMEYAIACIKPLYQMHTGLDKNITTISLVQGDALGGGFELAVAGDVLIAERSAQMGMPEILFNLFPGMGAYSFLSRKLGAMQAKKMILGGKLYSAKEMYELGLVDVLVEDGEGEKAVYNYIKEESHARNGIVALRQAARHVNPVTYQELEKITAIWVEAALRLNHRDLRMMERLVKRQSAKHM